MFLVGLLSWWYGRGWLGQWRRISDQLRATIQFFSIDQLLSTLFSPFRQISAATGVAANPAIAMKAFFDQLISRLIGFIVRSFTILAGCVVIILQAAYQLLVMIFWWFIPVLPVAGLILFAIGWVPTWI